MPILTPMTLTEVAILLSADPRTIAGWVSAGLPAKRRVRGKAVVDPAEAVAWIRAREKAAAEAKLAAALAQSTDPLDRKRTAEAQLREMDVATRKGDLVPRADIESKWMQLGNATREAVLAVPGMAVQLGLIDRSLERRLEDLVRDALTTLGREIKADNAEPEVIE